MFSPDDPLAPPGEVFDEAWQAQTLAMADSLVRAGHITATDWAEALGAELKAAERAGHPDTLDTYYTAALTALEKLSAAIGISADDQSTRKSQWTRAYLNTPHGAPVHLTAADATPHDHETHNH